MRHRHRHHFTTSRVLAEHGTPTSVAFVATDPNQVVVSFDGGEVVLYDLATEQSTTALETQTKDGTLRPKSLTLVQYPPFREIPCRLSRQRAYQPCGQSPV